VFSAATMATGFNLAAFGGDIDNQAENVYIRIWAKEESSGSGSRDSFGLSHFVLTYNELTGPVRTVRPTGSATLSYAMNDNTTRPAYSGEAADSVRGSFVVAANGSVSYFGGTTDNALVATGWTESGSIDLDADQRYAFDLRLADGVEGTVDEISFTAQRSSTGPSTLYVYSSQNPDSGFTLLGQTPVSVSESFAQFTFSNLALDFEDVCFFRVYGDGATASAGNLRFDDLSINLTVIPEPSTVLAMALGFGLLANELRRRRHSA